MRARRAFVPLFCAAAVACGLDLTGTPLPSSAEGGAPPGATPPGTPPASSSSGDSGGDGDSDGGAIEIPCTRGDGGVGLRCATGCVDPSRDRANCGGCAIACEGHASCEGTCVDVAKKLAALRYEIPCTNNATPACSIAIASPPDTVVTLTGTPGKTYSIALRVRGVVEQRNYNGATAGPATGTNAPFFAQGGNETGGDTWNIYDLRISAPAWTWHLNSGVSGNTFADGVDYVGTMIANAGAQITLHADSVDLAMAKNRTAAGDPIYVPAIPPFPAPFAGQFVQLDPTAVTLTE